jgi:predicted LPLAT superfamily acyltransferase
MERKWKGDTGGGALCQRALILFFRWFPLRLGYALMAAVIPFYMLFGREGYLSIYHYFRQQFGLSAWMSFWKTYRNHFLFGQVILDRFAVFAGKKDAFRVEIVGGEHFVRLMEGEKGFIVAGSHVGNFELTGYLLRSTKKPFNALIYALETHIVQQNRNKWLSSNNVNFIPVLEDMSHLFSIHAALQRGEIISMPCDRNLGSEKSVECAFLRGKADFPIGAFALATSFEVEILMIFCMKISARKYKIFVQPCRGFSDKGDISKREKIENLVVSYASALEKIVRQYPEQWFNYYGFWKN